MGSITTGFSPVFFKKLLKPETKKVGATTFQSTNESSVWGNVLTGGIIGYAVDAGTGAGFSYPPTLNVPMVYGDVIPPLPVNKQTKEKLVYMFINSFIANKFVF